MRNDGYTRAAVLGMGGSSLAPEVFSRTFGAGGATRDGLELRILDSTHPDAVRGFREWAQSARTIFCVSSKSGSTTEPNAFHAAMSDFAPALDFIAITDPGSSLAELARAQEFRAIVEGPPDVGGRYSALSVFGLVPAALVGVDLAALLDRAVAMAEACRRPAQSNPGLRLGAAIGEAALAGRDKLTILTSRRLASFGDWAEQLVAESTGKAGTGIVPVVGEPIGEAERYGADRCFVVVTLDEAAAPDLAELSELAELASTLEGLGHPVIRIGLSDAARAGRRVPALGGRHRRRRHGAGDRPLRPAERAGEQGRHPRAAGRVPRAGQPAGAGADRGRGRALRRRRQQRSWAMTR